MAMAWAGQTLQYSDTLAGQQHRTEALLTVWIDDDDTVGGGQRQAQAAHLQHSVGCKESNTRIICAHEEWP